MTTDARLGPGQATTWQIGGAGKEAGALIEAWIKTGAACPAK